MIYTIMLVFIAFAIGWWKGFDVGYRKGKLDANIKNWNNGKK